MLKKANIILYIILLFISSCKTSQKLIAKNAKLQLVSDAFMFTEGPAANKKGDVYFTDQPNNRIHIWYAQNNSISTFMENAGRSNGLYFDNEDNLISCADEKFELWKIDTLKNISVLLKDYKNLKLNGPNDLVVTPKGGIYFTDPYYQRPYWKRKKKEIEKEQVYYISPDNNTTKVVINDLVQPNGIIATPDGEKLYVADIGAKKTYSFTIKKDGSLVNKTLFANMGSDGMTIDNLGNIYLTGDGVTIFNSKGKKIHHIKVPQDWTANVTFGGPKQDILFITALHSIYTLKMNVNGVRY
ncbi:SMP-30/gluconolactonase/LRE family protein [uncultured Maribacter sp.]|uniref:SMP-30/gluconolactonase/LRE family protein n=1 Tax=uncultured Maribacter sp. TaxID=431308 RepID=UPI00260D2138|nr:SMP-30/gluconolactonase/LRE family protein [uncultured Maribacter sp.]